MNFQCQLINQDSYNSNSLGFDQPQPQQSTVIHQPPQELSIQEMEDLKQQYLYELKHLSNLEYRDEIKIAELKENFNGMSIEIRKKEKLLQLEQWANLSTHPSKCSNSFCYDDDEDYTIAFTSVLSTEEPDNSLSMGNEHLDTILATKSNEVIKSSVEDLIPIPSESEGIPEHMCDVLFHDNSPPLDVSKDQFEDFSESNDEFSLIDDDSFSFDKIDYVEASPPDSELVSSKVMEIVIPEVGGIDDDILREKLLNVNHLFAKIEASNDNSISFYDPIISRTPLTLTPSGEKGDILLLEAFINDEHSFEFKTKSSSTSLNSLLEETNNFDNSLPEFTTFSNVLFDAEYDFDSSNDQSFFDEDLPKKIYSNLLFDEEIIPMKIDPHSFNAESDLIESMPHHDSSIIISSKIDSLFDEFAGELTLLKSIPPGIDETDCHPEAETHFTKRLLYDNSSPRLSEEFVSENSNADIESFSPSPIPLRIVTLIRKKLIYPLIRMTQCRRALRKMMMTLKGIFQFLKNCLTIIPFHFLKLSHFILIFLNPIVLLQNHQMEKSPDLLSHRGLKAFQPFTKGPMMIHGQIILSWMFFYSIFIPLDQP
nr:hypothetical protein [Tanacetum cinerariifolium]